jgi:hypothetical protein
MAVGFDIKINAQQLQTRLKRLERQFSSSIDKGILQAGFQLLAIIREKTQKGIDINSNSFAPYSQGYLKQLQREGKPIRVDLFNTGRMMGALIPSGRTIKKTGKHKISVGFSNAEMRKRALFNQVLNEPTRKFFGFNKRTENIIQNSFNRFMKKEFNRMKI